MLGPPRSDGGSVKREKMNRLSAWNLASAPFSRASTLQDAKTRRGRLGGKNPCQSDGRTGDIAPPAMAKPEGAGRPPRCRQSARKFRPEICAGPAIDQRATGLYSARHGGAAAPWPTMRSFATSGLAKKQAWRAGQNELPAALPRLIGWHFVPCANFRVNSSEAPEGLSHVQYIYQRVLGSTEPTSAKGISGSEGARRHGVVQNRHGANAPTFGRNSFSLKLV